MAVAYRIRFTYGASDEYPRDICSEIKNDTYLLTSPLCRGIARIESDGQLLHDGEVCPGMLRLASPGELVRTIVRSPARWAQLQIPGSLLRQILDEQECLPSRGSGPYVAPLLQPSYQVERLCTALLAAPELHRPQRQLFVDGLAHSLLACLLGTHQRRSSSYRSGGEKGLSDAELTRAMEYADSMLGKGVDLQAWADALGMTAAEFARRFQLKTKQAPYGWFMNWRIDRAKQLLLDDRLPVAQIALLVGFGSQSHFTEAFRRRVGTAPGRWRAECGASGS